MNVNRSVAVSRQDLRDLPDLINVHEILLHLLRQRLRLNHGNIMKS